MPALFWLAPCLRRYSVTVTDLRSPRPSRLASLLGLLPATILTVACGTGPAQGQSQSSDLTSRLISDATQTAESVVATVSERLGVTLPTPAPLSNTVAPAPVESAPAPPRARRRPAPALPSAPEAVAAAPVAVVEEVLAPPVEPAPQPVATPVVAKPEDTTVYTSANVDVAPPRSPSPSKLRPWRADTALPGPSVEVTVARDGSVEKVRMLAAQQLSDMMILSHVKSWQFEPAQRDGETVRYRILLADPLVAP